MMAVKKKKKKRAEAWAAFQTAYSMSRYLISISTYSSSAKRVGTL